MLFYNWHFQIKSLLKNPKKTLRQTYEASYKSPLHWKIAYRIGFCFHKYNYGKCRLMNS